MNNRSAIIEKAESASIYARKHMIVYIFPVLFLIAGCYLLTQSDVLVKGLALVFISGAILRISQVAMVKWYLTPEYLIVRNGWPWAKKFQQISVFDLYESNAAPGKFSKFFGTATLTAKTREGSGAISTINITNAEEFCRQVSTVVKQSSAQPLNSALALKDRGMLTEKEYEVIKLGVFTQKYLGELGK